MNFLFKWAKSIEKCKVHQQEVFWVCYDLGCTNQRFICKDERCNFKHSGHRLTKYEDYKQNLANVQKHIKVREALTNSLDHFKTNTVNYLTGLFQEMKLNLFTNIDAKYCQTRFLQIQKLNKLKGDYIPLLYQYKEHIPQNIYREIDNLLFQKQKHFLKIINKQEVSIDINSIVQQKIQEFKITRREDQIKAILPFKCQLKLKFTASQNDFLTKKMYAVNIRGPIVLYVQSYKNKRFGGYSSLMFPKYEDDYSIQHRNINSFLFSLDHNQILHLKEQFKKYAIKGGMNFGFGQGDLLISDQCNKGNISWAEIGRTYKQPVNFKGPLNQWLAGASYFRVLQYQIYAVEGKRQK